MTGIFKIGQLYRTTCDIKLFDAAEDHNGGFLISIPKDSFLLLVSQDWESWEDQELNPHSYPRRKGGWSKTFLFDNKKVYDTTMTMDFPLLYFEEVE